MIDRIQTSHINNIKAEQNKSKTAFKGAGLPLAGLRWLNNSPAIGACAVDLCSMVIPRTVIEWKNRGTQSGIETGIREGTSNLIHTCVGMIGLGAATLLSGKFNKTYGVKAQNIFASGNTIENMAQIWNGANGNQREFFDGFLGGLKGLNGTEWVGISQDAKEGIVQGLTTLADKTKQLASAKGAAKGKLREEIKNLRSILTAKVVQDTGAQASFRLQAQNGAKEISASFSELADNAVAISNSFSTQSKEKLPEFIKSLKTNKTKSTVLGMLICLGLCMAVQPVNRWLTKRRTGSDGFVGVDNSDEKNIKKPQGYKTAKKILGIAFPIAAIRSIGKPADLLPNLQFNSKIPSINQFKFLYGATIASRFMSARDGNELRESVIKDTLGFTNWLILGGMVSKLTARGLGGKELINNPVTQDGAKKGIKYAFNWLTKATVKSYDEVLMPKAKEFIKDGKMMKFTEILKKADPDTKKKIYKIGLSQAAGYLYSGIVLGVGISKLNIFITKRVNARRKAKDKMNAQVNSEQNNKNTVGFLSQYKDKISPVFKEFK